MPRTKQTARMSTGGYKKNNNNVNNNSTPRMFDDLPRPMPPLEIHSLMVERTIAKQRAEHYSNKARAAITVYAECKEELKRLEARKALLLNDVAHYQGLAADANRDLKNVEHQLAEATNNTFNNQ